MYNLNSSLPAPYELNSPPMMTNPSVASYGTSPMMAHGGGVKHRKMIIAHFNPRELDVMDHLQGHSERCPKTGLRSYSPLEELLKNPHIVSNIHHHARRHHHTMGGHEHMHHGHHFHHAIGGAALHHLSAGGRHGDTELGLIGHHTRHLFDQLAGHPSINPHTGHPEYFNLKDFLGGAWNTIKGVGSAIAPVAGTALGTLFGGPAGGAAGLAAGQGLSRLLGGGGGQESSPALQGLRGGAERAWNAYQGGLSPQQALSHGAQYLGGRLGGGLGKTLQGFGSAYSQGQGLRGALGQAARTGFESLGGKEGLMNSARNIASGYGAPGGLRGAAMGELQGYKSRFMPPQPQEIPQPSYEGMPGITPEMYESL
jgi:hypothetical protein